MCLKPGNLTRENLSFDSLNNSILKNSILNNREFNQPLRLRCAVQQYDWGLPASSSLVARLGVPADLTKPCAELWMGAHPSAPATVFLGSVGVGADQAETAANPLLLDKLLSDYPQELLGAESVQKFGPILPFLFKVLSISRPLSIQAHPDKQLAEELHWNNAQHYPDSNHKPEMAIALTELRLLYGFRPWQELSRAVSNIASLQQLLGAEVCQRLLSYKDPTPVEEEQATRLLFQTMIAAEGERLKRCCHQLAVENLGAELVAEQAWVRSLIKDYPEGDVGLFAFLVLQLVTVKPGEAVFIGPNIAHAYLGGELIECMAASDNVVRSGLTSKFCDAETLKRMLRFKFEPPQRVLPSLSTTGVAIYSPPVVEFKVARLSGDSAAEPKGEPLTVEAPAILLTVEGGVTIEWETEGSTESRLTSAGDVYFLGKNLKNLKISAQQAFAFLATTNM